MASTSSPDIAPQSEGLPPTGPPFAAALLLLLLPAGPAFAAALLPLPPSCSSPLPLLLASALITWALQASRS